MRIDDRLRDWGAAARHDVSDVPDVPVARLQPRPARRLVPLAAAAAVVALVIGLAVAVHSRRTPVATAIATPTASPTHGPTTSSRNPCQLPRRSALSVYDPDGSLRWRKSLGAGLGQAPMVADGPIVYAAAAGSLLAYRTVDGARVWERRLGRSVQALWLVDGELVADVDQVSDNARIVAVAPATGALRWSYHVPGSGYLGDAALTSDGGLAFTVPAIKAVQVVDLSTGRLRWSITQGRPNPNTVPTAGAGVVLVLGTDHSLSARDSVTGALRWRIPNVDATGEVVISGGTGVVVPGAISGPTTVVAHSLADGAELWRYTFDYMPQVFPVRSGFLMADDWAAKWSLVDGGTGRAVWSARLRGAIGLRQQPPLTADGSVLIVQARDAVAFVNLAMGRVRRVIAPDGQGAAAAQGADAYVLGGSQIRRVSPSGVVWTRDLPQYPNGLPVTLADGSVAAVTEDPICLDAGGPLRVSPSPSR